MKNLVLKFGLLAGVIVSVFMIIGTNLAGRDINFDVAQVLGYAGMLIAFSTIFIATKKQRDADGFITFKKALQIGLIITLIASLMYTITWMIISGGPAASEMMDAYFQESIADIQASGATEAEIQKQVDRMNRMKENYGNPLYKFFLTFFVEIFPVGLIVSIISALILRKKG